MRQPLVGGSGLQRHLLVRTLLLSLVPLVVLAGVCAVVTEHLLMERFEADAVARAQAVTTRLRDRVTATSQAARMVAEIRPTRDALTMSEEASERLLIPFKTRLGLDVLSLADGSGKILAAAQDNLADTLPANLIAPLELRSEQSWIVGSEPDGSLLLRAAAPIRDGGTLVGIVEAGTLLDRDLLQPLVEPTGNTNAAAPTLIGLYWGRDARAGTSTSLAQVNPPDLENIRRAPTGRAVSHVVLNGTPYFAVFSLIESHQSTPLVAAVLVSTAAIESAREAMTAVVAILVTALALGISWMSYVFSGSFVRPLVRLADGARRVQAGNLDSPIEITSAHEVGLLENAFATMAGALKVRENRLSELIQQLEVRALTDELTRLPNRAALHQRVGEALERSAHDGQPVSLLLVDLDRFKDVNDTLGHGAGDVVLQQVAERFQHTVQTSDTVARLGGDEFAILLPNTSAPGAVRAAQKLLTSLEQPLAFDGSPLDIGASIGIASSTGHDDTAAALLRRADVAMYESKRRRSGVTTYDDDLDDNTPERLTLLGELRHAIANNQLVLHFQPTISLQDRRIVHVEALVRWQHPRRGLLAPDVFLPLAEQTGLMKPLTEWVLDSALSQIRRWHLRGLDIPVAVNVSAQNLQDPSLTPTIAASLGTHKIAASSLIVEITETSVIQDPERVAGVLNGLRELGVRIAIDDFGAGQSALAYLKKLPADELKIDRSFVRDMGASDHDGMIVGAAIDLGHRLGMRVVAEGVEDRATWDRLDELGCDIAQGYYMARPLDPADLDVWLAESAWGPADGLAQAA